MKDAIFCERCGAEAEEGHEYCSACEEELEDEASAGEAANFLADELKKSGEVGL